MKKYFMTMRRESSILEGNQQPISLSSDHVLLSAGTFLLSLFLIVAATGRTTGTLQAEKSCNEGFVSIYLGFVASD